MAAAVGLADWSAIPRGTRAHWIGAIHGTADATALGLFALSVLLQMGYPAFPPPSATILSAAGLVLALVGGWLGGELVFRLGIGVNLPDVAADSNQKPV